MSGWQRAPEHDWTHEDGTRLEAWVHYRHPDVVGLFKAGSRRIDAPALPPPPPPAPQPVLTHGYFRAEAEAEPECCGNCRFVVPWGPDTYGPDGMRYFGHCRRFPPNARSRCHAPVDAAGWCGEWKAKP